MKDNKELLVSFYSGRGDTIATGTKLEIIPLCKALWYQQNIDKSKEKGTSGCIFPYVQDRLGLNPERTNYSDGIIFIDIDKLPKSDIKCIYDGFESICDKLPNVLSCWYSNSYYNESKDYGGLHFVLRASNDTIDCDDYKYFVTFYGAILSRIIFNECGVDVRPTKDGKGLDRATKSIAQRFFLNYSQVKWNQTAYAVSPELDKKQLKEWVNAHNDWYKDSNPYKITKCEITKSDIVFNGNRVNLGYRGRITVLNTLATLGMGHSDRVELLMSICGDDDYRNGEEALRQNVTQCSRTAENQKVSDDIIVNGIEILNALGYDIQAEIERIYQPIDFDNTDLFMEVWESLKDQPYNNIYYNPKNYLRLNLKSSEYINDYKHQMNEMIYNYQMTYLIADCMVGKTTFGLNMRTDYGLFDDAFIMHISGDSIDLCVPYNSVADNKSKSTRDDIKRVMTKQLSDFKDDKRNVFIWNTVMPLYEKYFKGGFVKRLVIFFDESQKIVTDEYRWEVVFEMFKVLPIMYKHFVFMTGTPAGELDYLKQYFPDYCIIKVDKEIEFKRTCNILKYKSFGNCDREQLIEDAIAVGKLPMIYSNTKRVHWHNVCKEINKKRFELGLKPYRILDYSRDNAERLQQVNETNSIKDYDIVIATKYCSVGIDFKKDDNRTRYAIIDYATEQDCTFHDIWQFTLRNRNQDTETCIVAYDDDNYNTKLYNYWYYKKLFEDMAKVHTYKMVKSDIVEDDETESLYEFAHEIFRIRQFGNLMKDNKDYFNDDRNVKLLGLYYLYKKIFSNINIIKHMLKRRNVEVIETNMEHSKGTILQGDKKEMFNWYVDNFETISTMYKSKDKYDKLTYKIDINSNEKETIKDNRIYCRDVKYMDWLIKQFAGKDDWRNILNEIVEKDGCLTKEMFVAYNRMSLIAKKTTKKDIVKLKSLSELLGDEHIKQFAISLAYQHYGKILEIARNDFDKERIVADVIKHYIAILQFAIENIEFIEEIKKATDDGARIAACMKMDIAMRQQLECKRKQQISKKKSKVYTVKWIKGGKQKSFNGIAEMSEYFAVNESTIKRFLRGEKCELSRIIELIEIQ